MSEKTFPAIDPEKIALLKSDLEAYFAKYGPKRPPRVLDIPKVRYPYYWELEVSKSSIWVRFCRRPFGLFRNQIIPVASDGVSYRDGFVSHALLDEIEEVARKIHTDALGKYAERFSAHVPDHVKVKVRR